MLELKFQEFIDGVIESDKEIWGFGSNNFNQLGDCEKSTLSPVRLFRSLRNIKKLACGNNYTMMLTEEGHVYGVGKNTYYQIGADETYLPNQTPHWVESLKDKHIIQIACGEEHTICVSNEGKVYGFGRNNYYQLGNIKHLSQQPHVITSLDQYKVKDAFCGSVFTIIQTHEDILVGFGQNNVGQIGYSELTQQHFPRVIRELRHVDIASVSCGSSHTMVLARTGELFAFGSNESGQLGIPLASKATYQPTVVDFFRHTPIAKVVCGSYFTMVCCQDGTVYAFGQNNNGQLGIGNTVTKCVPNLVELDVNVVEIGCGFNYAILLSDEGHAFRTGQGTLNLSPSLKPTEIMKFRDIRVNTICSGLNHCLAYYSEDGPDIIPPPSILSDIARCFDDPKFSDLAFIVEDKPIYVNKFILSLRCEKFCIQFQSNMSDATAKEIIVNNVAYKHYYTFLKYLYTDTPSFDARDCVDVLNLANEHNVKRLVSICERMLKREIDVENASYLYQVASLYEIRALKSYCLNFILKPGNFVQVIKTETFKSLDKETILEILDGIPTAMQTENQ